MWWVEKDKEVFSEKIWSSGWSCLCPSAELFLNGFSLIFLFLRYTDDTDVNRSVVERVDRNWFAERSESCLESWSSRSSMLVTSLSPSGEDQMKDDEGLSIAFFCRFFSLFFSSVEFDSISIESFLSISLSSKSRFLHQFGPSIDLSFFFRCSSSMVNEQLFHFKLSRSVSSRFESDNQFEWLVHSWSNSAAGCLSNWTDRVDQCVIECLQHTRIDLCSHQPVGDHGESRSSGDIDDQQWRGTNSSLESGKSFDRSRWKSIQCQCKQSSLFLWRSFVDDHPSV